MCVVSAMGDHYKDKFRDPDWWKGINVPQPSITSPGISTQPFIVKMPEVSVEEFNALKKEVEKMKEILKIAKLYDERNNEPHCEMDEKVALLKAVAKMVGVDLSEVFDKPKTTEA